MIAIEETTTVQANGNLVLRHPELKPGEHVKVIVLFDADHGPEDKPRASGTGRRLKGDWGGGLADLAKEYTSVELQHKATEWRAAPWT